MDIPEYKAFEKDFEHNRIAVTAAIPERDDTGEYKRWAYEELRKTLGNELIPFIERFKTPCVVEIKETRWKDTYYWYEVEKIRLEAIVTNVSNNRVTIQSIQYLHPYQWKEMNIINRIKWIVTGRNPK